MSALTDTTASPAEVVTHAQVRYVDLPLDAGRFAPITLDNGSSRPNIRARAGWPRSGQRWTRSNTSTSWGWASSASRAASPPEPT